VLNVVSNKAILAPNNLFRLIIAVSRTTLARSATLIAVELS